MTLFQMKAHIPISKLHCEPRLLPVLPITRVISGCWLHSPAIVALPSTFPFGIKHSIISIFCWGNTFPKPGQQQQPRLWKKGFMLSTSASAIAVLLSHVTGDGFTQILPVNLSLGTIFTKVLEMPPVFSQSYDAHHCLEWTHKAEVAPQGSHSCLQECSAKRWVQIQACISLQCEVSWYEIQVHPKFKFFQFKFFRKSTSQRPQTLKLQPILGTS